MFSNVWSENTSLFERLMKIHSNPPKLYYGFNKLPGICVLFNVYPPRAVMQPDYTSKYALLQGIFRDVIRLRSGAHRTPWSPMGKPHTRSPVTPGTFETRFRWLVLGRITAPSRHMEMEKMCANSRFSLSFFRYRTYHRMSALFCRHNFQTNFGNFRYFIAIFSPFLWLSLRSTAPKPSVFLFISKQKT